MWYPYIFGDIYGFFQMIDGGLDASGKVVELERDTAIRSSLYKSPEYLSSVIRTKLQDSNNLAKKQIHLSHLKLQKGLLSSQDVLALDTLLNTVTDEARFKITQNKLTIKISSRYIGGTTLNCIMVWSLVGTH